VEPEVLTGTQEYKGKKIAVKKFDRDKWKEIAGTTDYNEKPEEVEEKPELDFKPQIAPWGGEMFRLLAYIVIVGVIIALLYYVLKNVSLDMKIRKEQLISLDITASVDNIEELDTQALLAKALAEGNLKLAVRLYYLGLLKKLNERGVIVWKKDKTNRDYLSELFSKGYHYEEVKKLTYAYELVWYGEHTLTPASFQRIIANFETVHQKINTPEAP
jgi:hypothetical protein